MKRLNDSTAVTFSNVSTRSTRPGLWAFAAVILTLLPCGTIRAGVAEDVRNAISRATQARDRATQARNSINEIRTQVREGIQHLTGEVRETIQEAVSDLKEQLLEAREGRQEFEEEGGCDEFRQRLVGVLIDFETLVNTAQELVMPCSNVGSLVSFENEIKLVEKIPCRLLYPISKLFNLDACFAEQLREGAESLLVLRDILAETVRQEAREALRREEDGEDANPLESFYALTGEDVETFDAEAGNAIRTFFAAEMASRGVWLSRYTEIRKLNGRLTKLASVCKLLGQVLQALGEKEFEANVGIHGYAIVTLSDNKAKTWGGIFEGVGIVLGDVTKKVKAKLDRTIDLAVPYMIIVNQERIIRTLEEGK